MPAVLQKAELMLPEQKVAGRPRAERTAPAAVRRMVAWGRLEAAPVLQKVLEAGRRRASVLPAAVLQTAASADCQAAVRRKASVLVPVRGPVRQTASVPVLQTAVVPEFGL